MKFDLKKSLKEVAIFVVMLFVISNVISYIRAPSLESDTLPALKMTLLDGSAFESEALSGKPLVIHFWATWCPACKAEASNIQSLSKSYEVLSIAVRSGSDEEVASYMKKNGYDFRVFNDSEGVWAERFHVSAFPTTFIFDAHGALKFTEVGYTTTIGLESRILFLK